MRWIYGLLALYWLVHIAVYTFQKSIIFQPDALAADHSFSFAHDFEEFFIPVDADITINAILFKPEGDAKRRMLYFHGNADNLQRWGRYARPLTDLGYEVLMMDYPGYGKSTGPLNEATYYRSAERVYDWALDHFGWEDPVIYGRSLGTAAATYLAAKHSPPLLILETPFDNMPAAIRDNAWYLFLPFPFRYRFPNDEYLAGVKAKTVIYHGDEDWLIPLRSALRLKPLLKPGDEFVVIEGGGHRNLGDFPAFRVHRGELLGRG